MQVTIQLAFNGQCREAFEFYERVLGGKIQVMNTFGSSGAGLPPGSTASASHHIRFAAMEVGHDTLLGNDVPAHQFKPMQGFNLSIHVQYAADARRIFDALADGGTVTTPLSEVAWSSAFGMVTDRFGTPWLILALDKQQG